MGDGTKESPFTREDVLRLIEKNGGKAEGLNLSGKIFQVGIDLGTLDLRGIILRVATLVSARLERAYLENARLERAILEDAHLEGAYLSGARLEGATLFNAHLEGAYLPGVHLEGAILLGARLERADLGDAHLEGAFLPGAHLEGAKLGGARLERADLGGAHLEGAYLSGAEFSPYTRLEDVDWGNYVLGEEKAGDLYPAAHTYRRLKQWHTNVGMYDRAGDFFFREMEARRKNYWWGSSQRKPFRDLFHPFKPKDFLRALFPRKPFPWAWSTLLSSLCGYGEKWQRVVIWAAVIIFGLAAAYYLWGSFSSSSFRDTLYYSIVSFVSLGYGRWTPQPSGWAKGAGAAEAFIGFFIMALFLITFTRKMTR